jgi:hypothetical protein
MAPVTIQNIPTVKQKKTIMTVLSNLMRALSLKGISVKDKVKIAQVHNFDDIIKIINVENSAVIAKRQEKKFDILNHLLHEDLTGKTRGCGCIICQMRHAAYKQQIELQKKEQLFKILSTAVERASRIQTRKFHKDIANPTATRIEKISHIPYGRVYLRDPGKLMNKVYVLKKEKRECKNKYITLQKGINAYNLLLGVTI